MIVAAMLWAGCAAVAPPVEELALSDQWMAIEPGKDLCVPGFAEVPWARRADARATAAARVALQSGDLAAADTHVAKVRAGHPAADGLRAVLLLLGADAEEPARSLTKLVSAHPDDPCLGSTAALALWAAGNREAAQQLVERARRHAPDDGRIAFVAWYLGLERAADLQPALDAGLAEHPGHPGMSLARGVADFERGDVAAALPQIRIAAQAGMAEADPPLLQAAFRLGDRAEYLRVASRMGLPLSDHGALALVDDPVAHYHALLGADPVVAHFVTSQGDLRCTLRTDLAPVTVANFVGLARGTQRWRDPHDGETVRRRLYDGTEFHRVIPGFMVQGGDPLGTGGGGPGYTFLDEIVEGVRFDRPGILAMANRGPHSNGSQFFVTEAAAPHLDGAYTIFGTCDEASVETVRRIARVPTEGTRPVEAVVLRSVRIGD